MIDFSKDNEAFKEVLKKDGYVTCCICDLDIALNSKDLVVCETCNLHFHKRCYGVHDCFTVKPVDIDLEEYRKYKDRFVGFEILGGEVKIKLKTKLFAPTSNPIFDTQLLPIPADWGEELKKEFEIWKEKFLGLHPEDGFEYVELEDVGFEEEDL